ncbi:MAG: TonB-dependent receptor [Bacteroidales bacterium]|nr:TonB-dependent receptor [Bacteroidales bacterium]
MKQLYLLFPLLLLGFFLAAQKGIIRGKIIDAETGEELIGAAVILEGTTIGASADLDGNFSIENIDPGTYDVKCQYISYETQIIRGAEIREGEVYILNIKLKPVSLGLEEVVVEARQIRRTEAALLTLQKKSATVLDGISAQQISRTGDSDAASALKRVTGVSVEGGKYVYVRGLSDRYTMTLLNGAELPGLDPNRNTVQMDLFPSNLIENMIVHKAFSPDLPGSFTGGLVDLQTRDFPETLTFRFSTSLGYNDQTSLNSSFLTYEGGDLDWLGVDDGTREVPVSPQDIPVYPVNRDLLDQTTMEFSKIMAPVEDASFLDHNHSLSLGNQTKLWGRQLGYIAGISYSRDYSYYDDGAVGFYRLLDPTSEVLNREYSYSDRQGEMNVLWGGMVNFSYKISDQHKLGINLIHNQSGSRSARYMTGEVPSDGIGRFRETRTLKFIERSLSSAQVRGEHHLKEMADIRITWLSSTALSRQDEPDLRFFTNSFYPEAPQGSRYSINPSEYRVPARYYRDMEQINVDNKIHFELPFHYLGISSKFRSGASWVYKKRTFHESRVDYLSQVTYFNGNVNEYLDDQFIGQNHPLYDPVTRQNYGLYVQDGSNLKNSYSSSESVLGLYAMLDMPVLQGVRITAGVRYETTDLYSKSENPKYEPGELMESDLLPSLNLTWSLTGKTNLRAGYNRTLARPTFREISPGDSEDFQGGIVYIGNPDLRRTLIDNLDIRFETFMRSGEIISVSGFYKKFNDPIELADDIRANNPQLTWINTDRANVFGFELELRKQLDFLRILRNVNIGANAAFVRSLVSIDSLELILIRTYDPDAEDTRSMFGQAPYIFNALLGYVSDSIGLDVSLSFNITGEKLAVVMRGGTPDVFEQPAGLLNLNLSKRIGKRISLSAGVENILNPERKFTYTYKDMEYIYRSYSTGRKFKAGISFRI